MRNHQENALSSRQPLVKNENVLLVSHHCHHDTIRPTGFFKQRQSAHPPSDALPICFCINIVFILMIVYCFQTRTRIVSTKYGQVQGFIERVGRDAEQLRHVEIYLGVPYASPPSGDYR